MNSVGCIFSKYGLVIPGNQIHISAQKPFYDKYILVDESYICFISIHSIIFTYPRPKFTKNCSEKKYNTKYLFFNFVSGLKLNVSLSFTVLML